MVFETNIICFGHTKHMKKKPNSQDECGVGERGGIIVCGRWTRSARPRGLGGDFEFLPLKSPRNPITPIETSRVATLHPELYKNLREGARRGLGATAKPLYAIDGKAEGLDLRNPRPPSSREGDRPQAVEGVGAGRRPSPSLLCRTSFYFPTHARHTRHKKHMKHTRNRS